MGRGRFSWPARPLGLLAVLLLPGAIQAQPASACPARPETGALVRDATALRSVDGTLRVELQYRSSVGPDRQRHYCYVTAAGDEAPTLRLHRGDVLILALRNELPPTPAAETMPLMATHAVNAGCGGAAMGPVATNLHFHGLTVPPRCHQDDVLHTLIPPSAPPFEYRIQIPADEPPGLYWYHPHVHGFSNAQVLGGASGALIVEGLEEAIPALAGLPERLFVIRDQELLHPDAVEQQTSTVPPPMVMRDSDGDILNTGTGGGKPAKDLSINFVPVPFPGYQPAQIRLRPGERQLWRILNASALTYLDLQLLVNGEIQALGVVALDGVPINQDGDPQRQVLWQSHALIPPAGRIELVVKAPPPGARASLVTRTVDTGPAGENDPTRPLADIIADAQAPPAAAHLDAAPAPAPAAHRPWLGDVEPVRTRRLYFSERPHDPNDPRSPTDFFITLQGHAPRAFDAGSKAPDIVVRQGDVEDWIIENRSTELHAFHIHQIHFLLREWNGIPLQEPFLRDTLNVAYWDGKSTEYPQVRLRMDFRAPNTVGDFAYHCHLLEHEDGGMMGIVRVEPRRSRGQVGERSAPQPPSSHGQ